MYCSYTRFCSSVRRDSFAAPVFRSARLQTVYCVKQVRHCFLFIASSFFVLLRSVLYPYRYINQRSKMKRKNSGCYFSSSMPDRKMRDAGRNRREDPGHTRCSFRLDKAGSTTSVFPVAARNFVANGTRFLPYVWIFCNITVRVKYALNR